MDETRKLVEEANKLRDQLKVCESALSGSERDVFRLSVEASTLRGVITQLFMALKS